MKNIQIQSDKSDQIIDITSKINKFLDEAKADTGLCVVTTAHTTCCLTTADLDPGTGKDLLEALRKMFPKGNYRHPHNPEHVGDHILSSIIGPSISLSVKQGELVLGTWQKAILVELNGPRKRELNLCFLTEK